MCFVLYIASPKALPIVPWDEAIRNIRTEELTERDSSVRERFKLSFVYYVGSDTHCGCGFRNTTYQNGSWPKEEWRPEDDTSHIEAQPNHERLVDFIRTHLSGQASCELYGMWEGNFSTPALSDQTIDLNRLLDLNFYFRDQGHYHVTINQ